MSKERPILFSAPMVRAILEGRKTQTRRIVKIPDHSVELSAHGYRSDLGHDAFAEFYTKGDYSSTNHAVMSGYGWLGDLLWVRESYTLGDMPISAQGAPHIKRHNVDGAVDWCLAAWYEGDPHPGGWFTSHGKKPSIHMPRWASRITLRITDVRVERLQSISEEDAVAEGITRLEGFGPKGDSEAWGISDMVAAIRPTLAYEYLWEHINGVGSWAKNPWVWVLEFEREEVTS